MTYDEAMALPTRKLDIRGSIIFADTTVVNLTSDMIVGFDCNEGGKFIPLGMAVAAQYSLELANTSGQWTYGGSLRGLREIAGSMVHIEIGVYHDSAFDYQDAGYWRVISISESRQRPTAVLYGADLCQFLYSTRNFVDGQTYPRTLTQILAYIDSSSVLQSTLRSNLNFSFATKPNWGVCTRRQALLWACQAGGSWIKNDKAGNYYLRHTYKDADVPVKLLSESDYIQLSANVSPPFVFNRINATPIEGGTPVSSAVDSGIAEADNNTIYISGNPLFSTAYNMQALVSSLSFGMNGLKFYPTYIKWRGTPSFGTYNVAGYQYSANGSAVGGSIIINNQRITYRNGMVFESECGVDF